MATCNDYRVPAPQAPDALATTLRELRSVISKHDARRCPGVTVAEVEAIRQAAAMLTSQAAVVEAARAATLLWMGERVDEAMQAEFMQLMLQLEARLAELDGVQ